MLEAKESAAEALREAKRRADEAEVAMKAAALKSEQVRTMTPPFARSRV